MPTQQMDDAIPIEEVKAKALRIAPLAAPQRALGPLPSPPRTVLPGAVGTRRDEGAIDPQYHHRPATVACRHRRDAPLNLVARWRHVQHGVAGVIGGFFTVVEVAKIMTF
jgi:hypothetical protein